MALRGLWYGALALSALVTITGSSTAAAAAGPQGFWRCAVASQRVYLAILPNGRLSFDGAGAAYSIAGSTLRVRQSGGVATYPFRLAGRGRMTVTMPNGKRMRCSAVSLKGAAALRGMLCAWSGSSSSYARTSISRTTRVAFDGRGGLRYASEGSFSGPGGRHANRNRTQSGMYRVVGKRILLVFPDGSGGTAWVHMRQRSGRITEVKYNGQLFGAALCK